VKKTLSLMLAVLFTFTAFGGMTLFSGVFSASAEFYDYFTYTPIPGFSAFTESGLKSAHQPNSTFKGFSEELVPEGSAADQMAVFTVTSTDEWGGAFFHAFAQQTMLDQGANWAVNDLIEGTDIFGNTDHSFDYATGIIFNVNVNGVPYQNGDISIYLFQLPAKGPYYTAGDYMIYPTGALYGAHGKYADADGYIYFDFGTDFHQADWWSKDDDGENQWDMGNTPVPKSKLPILNGLRVRISSAVAGDEVAIGDIRICYDTRIHTDELDEQLSTFDSLDPESFTEESYAATAEVYLRAYEMYLAADSYTQREIDTITGELKRSIKALVPLFHARYDGIELESFESWSEEELDLISGAGLDSVTVSEDVVPVGKDKSILVMANAVNGEPTYGWSWFTNGDEQEDSVTAIGNPFALKEGSEALSNASGIRFWLKWDEILDPIPTAMRIGLGSSTSGVYFECDDYSIKLPESEGYVGAAWTAFYDIEGDADIYDYIDELDYISIFIEGAVGIYYIADLHGFEWNISSADFEPLQRKINDTYTYMSTLNRDEWYYASWDKVMMALAEGEAIIGQYGITDEDVRAAIDAIDSAVSKLIPIGNDDMTYKTRLELEAIIDVADDIWRGNVTPATFRLLLLAIDEGKRILEENAKEKDALAAKTAIREAIAGLIPITGETFGDVYSVEDMSSRDFNKSNAHRHADALYYLVNADEVPGIPEGYAKAVKMTTTEKLLENYTSTGTRTRMTFKVFTEAGQPLKLGPNNENIMFGDLNGSDGIRVWVSISDMSKVTQECVYFSVSNTVAAPHFGWSTDNCLFPTTGSGWVYIPWECMDIPDTWYEGQPLDLARIYHWSILIGGVWEEAGLSAYATGIQAYKGSTTTWNAPGIKNITDGQVIDVKGGSFKPDWAEGSALLTEKSDSSTVKDFELYFTYGDSLDTNGEYTLKVINGDKEETVNFTIVGGKQTDYETPVVSGVEEGGEYDMAIVSWDVGTATLNGEPISNGAIILTPGEYTLEVTNGNKQTVVNFKIVSVAPPATDIPFINLSISGYEYDAESSEISGEILSAGAEIGVFYISDKFAPESEPVEGKLAADTEYWAIFNLEAKEGYNISKITPDDINISGVEYEEILLDHYLPTSCAIGIKLPTLSAPGPEYKKGDFDGDGELTVADALAALRIAARMAESSDEAIAIGDIDADGEITVADALAILRVAAKMADSL